VSQPDQEAKTPLRLGTRSSALALWQAHWVADRLQALGAPVELIHITTVGDRKSGPIGQLGAQGVFTKEIQRALLDGQIDLAVHSLKDLPTDPIGGLQLAAVPDRESPSDVLVSSVADSIHDLPEASRIGTGSVRRRAQLLAVRPDLSILPIRGNVDTRLRKLNDGEYDGLILAEAGLRRLGRVGPHANTIPREIMLPAVGQGALGLEIRADDELTRATIAGLDDEATHLAVLAERSLLSTLRGGCLAPVGAWGRCEAERLTLDAVVLSSDGSQRLAVQMCGALDQAEQVGREAAAELLRQGAAELIRAARDT
jgi:hydroxymethylbilane synthase